MRTIVLAYLAANGPLPLSDIWHAIADEMSDTYVKLTLKSLVERVEVIAATEEITREVRSQFGKTRPAILLVTTYRIATTPGPPAKRDSQSPRPSGPVSRRDRPKPPRG
ncbi:hypothetical protein ACYOEI_13990 [Singulisphaera rosea]